MAKPNNCCISCKNIEDLFSLYDVHECSDIGDIDASANMLKECFNIEIIRASNFTSICGQCMLRLRDAHQFRKDIIKSIQELQKQLCFIKADSTNTITPNAKSLIKNSDELCLDPKSGNEKTAENNDENLNLNIVSHENNLFIELRPLEKREAEGYQATENHHKIEQGQTICTVCNLTFPSTKSLQGHMNVHYARYVCDKCSARFEADHKLRRHMATVHMEGPFICTICDQAFSKLNTLNAHIWRVHQTLDPYKCTECAQRFRTFHKRLRHLQDDHGRREAKYPCTYCDKKFFYAGSRSTHIRLTHLQERRHRCPHCPMAFGKRRMLLSHMCTIHDIGEKKYQCDKCQKRFYKNVTLRYHMKTHENAEQESHQCPICQARFSYKNYLKYHMKCHKDAQDSTSMTECHRNAQEVISTKECEKDAQDVTSITECHKDAQDSTPMTEFQDAHEVTSMIEYDEVAQDNISVTECHRDAQDVTSITECHKDAQEFQSIEENVVIVDDKLYDVTNDIVYLEVYET